jgi:hypothetical protein
MKVHGRIFDGILPADRLPDGFTDIESLEEFMMTPSQALRALRDCTQPTSPTNISGPETISVRALAQAFGKCLDGEWLFAGIEASAGWLVNTSQATELFGYTQVPLARMIDWVADWVSKDMPSLGKPKQFDVRDRIFTAPKK